MEASLERTITISIHALREEGDPSTQVLLLSWY